jgi:hypothetical protein
MLKIMLRRFKLTASITSVQRSFIRAMAILIPPFRMQTEHRRIHIALFTDKPSQNMLAINW